jgi:hypothetical protein
MQSDFATSEARRTRRNLHGTKADGGEVSTGFDPPGGFGGIVAIRSDDQLRQNQTTDDTSASPDFSQRL